MFQDYLRNLGVFGAIAVATIGLPAPAQPITVLPVPSEIQLPAGNIAFLKGYAVGTQNYVCLPSTNGFAWKFQAPQATLFLGFRGSMARFATRSPRTSSAPIPWKPAHRRAQRGRVPRAPAWYGPGGSRNPAIRITSNQVRFRGSCWKRPVPSADLQAGQCSRKLPLCSV